jgi:hypothetical protein
MKRLIANWNKFWFEEQPCLTIGFYRFVFGALMMLDFFTLLPDVGKFFGDSGLIRNQTARLLWGGEHFSPLYSIQTPLGLHFFFGVYLLALILFTLGLGTRIVKFIVYFMLISWHHRNIFILSGNDTFTAPTAFLFLFTPCERAFSLDAVLRRMRHGTNTKEPPATGSFWGQRLMQFQLSAVYLFALTYKMHDEAWRDGTMVYYVQHMVDFYQLPVPWIKTSLIAVNFATYATLLIQLCLATFVWVPAFRPYVLLAGLGEHLIMAWNTNLVIFQLILIAGFIPFLDSRTVQHWLRNGRRWLSFCT